MLTIIPFIIFLLFSECSSGRRDVRQIDVELRPVGVEGDQPFTALIFTATTATTWVSWLCPSSDPTDPHPHPPPPPELYKSHIRGDPYSGPRLKSVQKSAVGQLELSA